MGLVLDREVEGLAREAGSGLGLEPGLAILANHINFLEPWCQASVISLKPRFLPCPAHCMGRTESPVPVLCGDLGLGCRRPSAGLLWGAGVGVQVAWLRLASPLLHVDVAAHRSVLPWLGFSGLLKPLTEKEEVRLLVVLQAQLTPILC